MAVCVALHLSLNFYQEMDSTLLEATLKNIAKQSQQLAVSCPATEELKEEDATTLKNIANLRQDIADILENDFLKYFPALLSCIEISGTEIWNKTVEWLNEIKILPPAASKSCSKKSLMIAHCMELGFSIFDLTNIT